MQTTASFPFIFSYGQAWAVEALGRNLGAVRLPSAVCGALTVPALYVLARTLFGRTTALAAALILAGFPPHLHYSRLALNNIADPLFGTWALAFIARGLRHNHRLDYALGGVMLGLTQYFYEGGRLFFPLLALGWLAAGLILWRPRPALRGAIVMLVAFALVGFPLYYTLISMDFPLIDRLEKTRLDDIYPELDNGSGTLRTRLVHFRQSLMLYVNAPENTIFYYYLYYGGKHPLILEYLVPLFFLGLVFALWRWRGPGVLPLGWVLLTSAGNAMLVESGVTARYVIAFPALALLVALGLRETVRLLWPQRFAERLQTGAVAAAAVIIMAGQAWFYFGPFLDYFHVEVHESPTSDVDDAILRSKNFPPGTHIHIVAEGIMMAADDAQRFADFLADDLTVEIIPPDDITLETLLKLPRDVDHAFYVLPHDAPVLVELNKTFGLETVELSPFENVPDDKELWLYYVPAPSDPPEPPD